MAKITAPFLSMSARGSVGKTLVASAWKGVKYMRQHIVPANPSTAAQVAQRALFSSVTQFWTICQNAAGIVAAWQLLAANKPKPISAFNAFAGVAMLIGKLTPAANFLHHFTRTASSQVTFSVYALDTCSYGAEAGNFDLYGGPRPTELTLICSAAIITYGDIVFPGLPAEAVYFILKKGDTNRSGLVYLPQA